MVTLVSCMHTTWTCSPGLIQVVPSLRRRTFFEPHRTTSRWFVRPADWPCTTTSASVLDFTVSAPSNERSGFASEGGGVLVGGATGADADAGAEAEAAAGANAEAEAEAEAGVADADADADAGAGDDDEAVVVVVAAVEVGAAVFSASAVGASLGFAVGAPDTLSMPLEYANAPPAPPEIMTPSATIHATPPFRFGGMYVLSGKGSMGTGRAGACGAGPCGCAG